MKNPELARTIYQVTYLRGDFTLRSGSVASEYFDKYQFESEPLLLHRIAESLAEFVPAGTHALAGLELGGVPLATVLSQVTGLPAVFVRKAAKTYGTCRLAEGGEISGKSLLLVEDVVTSGGQILESASQLRSRGARVSHTLCVIDREAGGEAALAQAGIALTSLFSMRELKSAAA